MQSVSEIQAFLKQIKSLLPTRGIAYVLQELKQQLSPNSAHYNEVLLLESRLQKINTDDYKGIASYEQISLTHAQLRDDLLMLIDRLEPADFSNIDMPEIKFKETVKVNNDNNITPMLNKKQISIENSKNVVQESAITTGRDAHIGDNINVTNYGLGALIWGILLMCTIVILLVFNFDTIRFFFTNSPDSIANVDLKVTQIDSLLIKNDTPKSIAPTIEANSGSPPKSKRIGLIFEATTNEFAEIGQAIIGEYLMKQGYSVITRRGKDEFMNQEMICKVIVNQSEREIGIQTFINVSFMIMVRIEGDLNDSIIADSPNYIIQSGHEIPEIFKNWLYTIEDNFQIKNTIQ